MRSHPNRSRVAARTAVEAIKKARDHEHDYSALLIGVRASFSWVASIPLFTTDVVGLNELYLDSLPAERQVHNCHACRHFIERFGGLVAIRDGGVMIPAMWEVEDVPEFYAPVFSALRDRVRRARVTGVFYSKETVWGTPVTGAWSHIAVVPSPGSVYRERALTAQQAMAAVKENFRTVAAALAEMKPVALDEALRILNADAVSRSERFVAPVKWLRDLHDRPKGRLGENVLWREVATAPEGFCHPKVSMVGPLLDDIVAGLPFDDIKRRFDEKMHPLRYQRPQAAPSAGNIKAAEALVEKLGIARSLERRFARIDDVKTWLWRPSEDAAPPAIGGVFGHIKPKGEHVERVDLPATTMTWAKFAANVLPTARKIEILVPQQGSFVALTTAVHADAPPIFKWDREDERNTVAWYLHHPSGIAENWNLVGGSWTKVVGITPHPTMWGQRSMPQLADGVILIIAGAVDRRSNRAQFGNALFPECLREELHGVRSTVEAYSRSAMLAGEDEASACGYDFRKGNVINVSLRVDGNSYLIDRWD